MRLIKASVGRDAVFRVCKAQILFLKQSFFLKAQNFASCDNQMIMQINVKALG
jgi:hypothetical protein